MGSDARIGTPRRGPARGHIERLRAGGSSGRGDEVPHSVLHYATLRELESEAANESDLPR